MLAKSQNTYYMVGRSWSCVPCPPAHRELADIDKDGRLSLEEFAIAMHLVQKAKSGLMLPKTLPIDLRPVPGVKYNTMDRPRKMSEDTFEDRKKENFELGRMELERRRKARQEELDKAKVRPFPFRGIVTLTM